MKFRSGLLVFYFLFFHVSAQFIDMKFSDPFTDISLSNSSATCITQDSIGQIWIGTQNGLNRFDGYDLNIYTYKVKDNNTISSYHVKCLYYDSNYRLWVGTNNGLCKYNDINDDFTRIFSQNDTSGIIDYNIVQLAEDQYQNLYIANSLGVYKYNENEYTIKPVYMVKKGDLSSFLFDKYNNLWIGTIKGGGLIKYNLQTKTETIFLNDPNDPNSISDNSPSDLVLQYNWLWIATIEGGFNRLDIRTGEFKHYQKNNELEKNTRKIYLDRDNRIWGTDIVGLKLYDPQTDQFFGYYTNANNPNSIKDGVIGIYQDKQRNYWTFHSYSGVGLRMIPKGFKYYNSDASKFWYVSRYGVLGMATDGYGNLWFGNPANGIHVFNWQKEKIETYFNQSGDKGGPGPGTIHCIYKDNENTMWIGSHKGGLQYFDPKTKSFISFLNDPNNPKSIAGNDVRSIIEDNNNGLWVVPHGFGLDRFDKKTMTFTHFTPENSDLANIYAFQSLMDKKGNLWVATVWGLSLLPKGEQQFINFRNDPDNSNSLSNNMVKCLHEDDLGEIWIGTEQGLNKFNFSDSTFTKFGKGFVNTNINAILSDRKGNVWCSSSDGITFMDRVSKEVLNFDKRDGLITKEFNERSSMSYENTLYFGGAEGVVYFNPDQLNFNLQPPRIILTEIKLFNETLEPNDSTGIIKKAAPLCNKINLKYEHNVVTLKYAAINFINTDKNTYKYKLEGFDKDWVDAGFDREVTYTNLNPGEYIFRVIAGNNDGIWNNQGLSVKIKIAPPWWKTWWFRIALVILVSIIMISVFYLRTQQLRKQKAILADLVKQRTMELEFKNVQLENQADDLNNVNTLLEERQQRVEEQSEELYSQTEKLKLVNTDLEKSNQTKNRLFSIIAHDLKDPFNSILGFAEFLNDEFDEIEENEKKKMVKAINDSSKKVHELLDNLLKWARSQLGSIILNKQDINIHLMLRNIYYVLKVSLSIKKINLEMDVPEHLSFYGDENTIQTVLRNLINNAVKFTEKGTIKVKAYKGNEQVTIEVSDNGVGIDEETLNNLFVANKIKSKKGTSGEKGSGLGLIICKEFIELNEGKIWVESEIGKGSTFFVTLPISK